ncbi:hypothetical protein PCA31118_05108 [Pandoraea captiosa]|uniref:Transcriptional regulator-like domain-containing protein n=2 Tax=Pandoraea captiosa TaxID=2508302 RepID=A0A5E5AQE6_9BURK|nr:hypothetical protein PCA31118_05108 [Pandoraea captiosa]
MAMACVPDEFRLFVVRADWRDSNLYPRDTLHDPSIWAWEFLRRNNGYARDYDYWNDRVCEDVPAIPLPKMLLDGYYCDPEAIPGMRYDEYKKAYPIHVVLSVQDYLRERWGVIRLVDPSLSAAEVEKRFPGDDPRNRLSWIFASTTPQVISPAPGFSAKSYLFHKHLSLPVSGYCTGTEVMVRLDITGNFDVQMDSLRRKIGGLFEGGDRGGETLSGSREQFLQILEHSVGSSVDADQREALEAFLAVNSNWNSTSARYDTLQSTARMVDLIGSLEAGTLKGELEAKWGDKFPPISVSGLDFSLNPYLSPSPAHYLQEHLRIRVPLRKALHKYFTFHHLSGGKSVIKLINRCLDNAYQFAGGGHAQVARMSPPKRTKKKR